jgi:hypothetical protein
VIEYAAANRGNRRGAAAICVCSLVLWAHARANKDPPGEYIKEGEMLSYTSLSNVCRYMCGAARDNLV